MLDLDDFKKLAERVTAQGVLLVWLLNAVRLNDPGALDELATNLKAQLVGATGDKKALLDIQLGYLDQIFKAEAAFKAAHPAPPT